MSCGKTSAFILMRSASVDTGAHGSRDTDDADDDEAAADEAAGAATTSVDGAGSALVPGGAGASLGMAPLGISADASSGKQPRDASAEKH